MLDSGQIALQRDKCLHCPHPHHLSSSEGQAFHHPRPWYFQTMHHHWRMWQYQCHRVQMCICKWLRLKKLVAALLAGIEEIVGAASQIFALGLEARPDRWEPATRPASTVPELVMWT